jgi:putative transport protein
MSELLSNDLFLLFAIIGLGKALERVRIGRFSLGIAAVFLVAAAAGALGVKLSDGWRLFGLVIFVYAVGIEAGPQFFSSLRRQGRSWLSVPLIFIGGSALLFLGLAFALDGFLDKRSFIGLFAGAFTCTPAMAAALDQLGDPAISVAFGIAYPLSLVGAILLIPALPRLFGDDLEEARREHERRHPRPGARAFRFFRVRNQSAAGRSLDEIRSLARPGLVFTRYVRGGATEVARGDIVLEAEALVGAVGSMEDLAGLEVLLGPVEPSEIPMPRTMQSRRLIVSSREVAGKSLEEILAARHVDVRITRLIRSGVELPPEPRGIVLLGDRLDVFGAEEDLRVFLDLVGDDLEDAYLTQFAPISMGIALGFVAGLLPLPFLSYPLGVTGGVLIVAMFLGYKVRFAGVLWQIPHSATSFIKQFGLSLFFAALGVSIGPHVASTLAEPRNWALLGLALALDFLPLIAMYWIATRLARKNPLEALGLLGGSVNNSTVLASLNDRIGSEIPNAPFAFAYPLGLMLTMLCSQALAIALG